MQNSGRTKFKRTSIDRLMNTLVLWVSFPAASAALEEVLPIIPLPLGFLWAAARRGCSGAGFNLRPLSDLVHVIFKNLRNMHESTT